jgi:lambda repressor-like predicted transcriptional regulator
MGTHTSRDKKIEIKTLASASWSRSKISRKTGVPRSTVIRILRQKQIYNEAKRKRLVAYVKENRQISLRDLAKCQEGSINTLRAALKKEEVNLRIARKEPVLTEAHRQARLEFCRKWRNLTPTD